MSVRTRWILPIVRLLIIAFVAVALGKLAFFPDAPPAAEPTTPTGQVVDPVTTAAIGDVATDVVVDATISADPAASVKSTAAGTVDELFAPIGGTVAAGDVLYDVKVEIPRDPSRNTSGDGEPPAPLYRFEKVRSPIGGTLTSLSIITGQTVAVGEATAQVTPPTFSVSGTLQPAQRYRLTSQPTEASIAITGGPGPFTCNALVIRSSPPGAPTDGGSGGGGSAAGSGSSGANTTVSCPVPPEITVFPGLAAKMTISGGRADGVLLVPTTAVRGVAQSGTVWVVGKKGQREERPVVLGLSDGRSVQIVSGLNEGEKLLQFAPGASGASENPEGCAADTITPCGSAP